LINCILNLVFKLPFKELLIHQQLLLLEILDLDKKLILIIRNFLIKYQCPTFL
jgi:hypothetical protein